MDTIRHSLPILAACMAALPISASPAAGQAAAEPAAAKPWEPQHCGWWLSEEEGRSHRASISPGDTGLVMSFSDPIFATWPETGRPRVELLFDGNSRERVETEGWASHGSDGSGMFGVELDAAALGKLAGATRLELRRDGRSILVLRLAGTPDRKALLDCLPPPKTEDSDEE